MKTIAIVLLIAATASALEWTDLRVKWNSWLLDYFRWNSMFQVPRTLHKAVQEKWVEAKGLNALGLTTYCLPQDGIVCLLFDSHGHIGGFQAGILAGDLVKASEVYTTSKFSMYQNKTIFGASYVTSTIYTVDPKTLVAGGRANWKNLTGDAGIWIENSDGTYMEIPRRATDLDPIWVKENCIPEMGTHYYYDTHPDSDCVNFLPWFLLYENGTLSGAGIQAFGACTIKKRSWCEWVPAAAVLPTVPTTPQCLIDWADKYGLISIHFYFTPEPWNIKC